MQITDTFIAMPLKAIFCNPKHSHAEARAVAPAGGRREGGGREGGREPQTWSERAAWREGDVIDCSCVRHGSAGSKRLSGWAYSETVVSQGTNYIDAASKAQSRELGKHSESSKQPRPREGERKGFDRAPTRGGRKGFERAPTRGGRKRFERDPQGERGRGDWGLIITPWGG